MKNKTPSTKDTIGCATEVKQPAVPELKGFWISGYKLKPVFVSGEMYDEFVKKWHKHVNNSWGIIVKYVNSYEFSKEQRSNKLFSNTRS